MSEKHLQIKNLDSRVSKAQVLNPNCDGIKIEFSFEINGTKMFVEKKFSLAELAKLVDKSGDQD